MKAINKLTRKAFAKINIFLEVLYKRDDDYHEIRTIMQTISLHDLITIEKSKKDEFILDSKYENIPTDERNLVIKALKKFREYTGITTPYKITLIKNIPPQSGLSGASTDAANALKILNFLEGQPLELGDLLKIGEELGSDVNFHFFGGTCLCTGRGEKVEVLPSLKIDNYLFIVIPETGVSTVNAYRKMKNFLHLPKKNINFNYLFLKRYLLDDCSDLMYNVHNDFEEVILAESLDIKKIKEEIENIIGVKKVWLTGSGSALVVNSELDIVGKIEKIEGIKEVKQVTIVNTI